MYSSLPYPFERGQVWTMKVTSPELFGQGSKIKILGPDRNGFVKYRDLSPRINLRKKWSAGKNLILNYYELSPRRQGELDREYLLGSSNF